VSLSVQVSIALEGIAMRARVVMDNMNLDEYIVMDDHSSYYSMRYILNIERVKEKERVLAC